MFTTGSKLFFGAAVFATIASITYLSSSDWEWVGTFVLFSFLAAAIWLAAVVVAFRDVTSTSRVAAGGVSLSAADAEGGSASSGGVSSSVAPIIGAFGLGLLALGLALDSRFFLLGLAAGVIALVEWTVSAWADRASADPAYNKRLRDKILQPFEFPILGALSVGVVIFGFSRVMLAASEHGALAAFIVIAVLIFGVSVLLSTRQRIGKNVFPGILALGAVGILAAGVAGIAHGERGMELNDSKSSRAVADKAALYGTVTFDGTNASLSLQYIGGKGLAADKLNLPKGLLVSMLFDNKGPDKVALTAHAGTKSVKDSAGNAVDLPVTFNTELISTGKSATITMRFANPGTYSLTIDSESGKLAEIPVVVS